MRKRYRILITVNLICLLLMACNSKSSNETRRNESNVTTEVSDSATSSEENSNSGKSNIVETDFADCFHGIDGCAVFYDAEANEYQMYGRDLCEKQASPCSTFKIIATLMGLEYGVLDSVETTMGYDGTIYPIASWNKDLSLKEAFQASCVWYFRKVIDQVGPEKVQAVLNKLDYGNCDISEWKGSGINSTADTNGFWLESSLKISPVDMVTALSKILEGKSDFSKKNIELLKEVMLIEENGSSAIYGKTGTGVHGNAWFAGMLKMESKSYYFAIRLTKDSKEINGPKAKEIALEVIHQYYLKDR